MSSGWRCQHGRTMCRSCNFGLDNFAASEPPKPNDQWPVLKSQARSAYQGAIKDIESDIRMGENVQLSRNDWLVTHGLFPADQPLTINDVSNAKHHIEHVLAERTVR